MATDKPSAGLDMRHARTDEQAKQMSELIAKGICPFCEEYLRRHHREPIERIGRYWVVTRNDYEYEGARVHYLFILREHAEDIDQLTPDMFAELLEHVQWVREVYGLKGGSFFMRFGETSYTGATISHLHAHLVAGASADESPEKIKTTVGYQMPR